MAGIGFLFWTITARLYTTEQIGLATTLISITSLITGFSLFGFNNAIIRFLPSTKDKNSFMNTAIGVIAIGSIGISILFLAGLPIFSPKLAFLQHYPMFEISFVVFMAIASMNAITDSVFLSYRRAEFTLVINTIMSFVKLALPFAFIAMGAYGIFYAFMASINVAFVLSIFCLTIFFHYKFFPVIRKQDLQKVWRFTTGNYISSLFSMLPGTLTPLIITNTLGPTTTAYYFMPSMILQMVLAIPRSMSSSFFSETSQAKTPLRPLFFQSLKTTYSILIPITLLIILFGKYILLFFGKNYSEQGYPYLVLVLIAINLSIPNYFAAQILNVRHHVKRLMLLSIINVVISLGSLLIFIPMGLYGIGLASIVSSLIALLVHAFFLIKYT
jgi:O-antigen/teichoic acid export membrane protein